jgi:hypothetical protein
MMGESIDIVGVLKNIWSSMTQEDHERIWDQLNEILNHHTRAAAEASKASNTIEII